MDIFALEEVKEQCRKAAATSDVMSAQNKEAYSFIKLQCIFLIETLESQMNAVRNMCMAAEGTGNMEVRDAFVNLNITMSNQEYGILQEIKNYCSQIIES